MTATVSLCVMTGSSAQTVTGPITGISFFGDLDSAVTALADRQAHPVVRASASVEKHLRIRLDSAPANSLTRFKFWMTGSAPSGVALRAKLGVGTGGTSPGSDDSTPSSTAMSGDADAFSYTTSSRGVIDAGPYASSGQITKAFLLQLQPGASAATGTMAQMSTHFSYEES